MYKNYKEMRSTGSTTFTAIQKGMKDENVVFCSAYNERTLYQNLQKWSLACKEHGNIQTRYRLRSVYSQDFRFIT